MEIEIYQVDAFTRELFTGNPAGVVTNADGLDEVAMQKIAREMNLSETAFIINRKTERYDIEVRFFTPTREVPVCGHATISAHYVYAKKKGIERGIIRQKTKAGILPVEITQIGDDLRVLMTQGDIEFGEILTGENRSRLLEGLGLDEMKIPGDLPFQIVSTGHSKVMVPVDSKETLDRISPREDILSELSVSIGCNGYYLFTFDSREENVMASGRMFAPAIGISEDPVTGNANGPLGAYLVKHGKIKPESGKCCFTIKQGEAIGRKGYMDVIVSCKGNQPDLVRISGDARIVFKTKISL